MKSDKTGRKTEPEQSAKRPQSATPGEMLNTDIGDSIDVLVEYLVDNEVQGIHPLIMGEVEKRLIVKVLERSRGNKVKAAKWLGMSRNTFHRKMQKMGEAASTADTEPEA